MSVRPTRTYKVRTDSQHALAPARFQITRGGMVLTQQFVGVHQDDWFVRDGVGRCRCTLCKRSINNIARQRKKHLESGLHRQNLERLPT